MEVHHHSSGPAKEKHFRHYLFEFLMLFLAISAGFLVENLREHYVENFGIDTGNRSHCAT